MMDFKKYLEMVATGTSIGNNIINNNDNDDGGDDDDEQWSWDNVHKRYGQAIQQWVDNDPFAKKIKGKLIQLIFAQKPQAGDVDVFNSTGSERVESEGYAELRIKWELPDDAYEGKLINTLRKSNLWKVFRIQPNQLWNFLDKGWVSEYVSHVIIMSISAINVNEPLTDKTDINYGQKWVASQQNWLSDKLTISKYAKFVAQDIDKQYEQHVKEYIIDYYNMGRKDRASDAELSVHTRKGRGQHYGNQLQAEVTIVWKYKITE